MNDDFRQQVRKALEEGIEPPSADLRERAFAAAIPTGAAALPWFLNLWHWVLRHWLLTSLGVGGTAAAVVVGAVLLTRPAPPPVDVYAGYADTVTQPNSAHVLQPFGPPDRPGYAYRGSGPPFDSGAVRIDNRSGDTLTLDRVWVEVGDKRYELWGQRLQVPAHGTLVVTQTRLVSRNPLESDFDTSEASPGTCAQPNRTIPVVRIAFEGRTYSFLDSHQVRNTHGKDVGACPGNTDESHAWERLSAA